MTALAPQDLDPSPPKQYGSLLILAAVSVVAGMALADSVLWNAVVFVHEVGHLVAAKMAGGEAVEFVVVYGEGGFARSAGTEGFGRIMVLAGGFLATATVGSFFLWMSARITSGRLLFGLLSLLSLDHPVGAGVVVRRRWGGGLRPDDLVPHLPVSGLLRGSRFRAVG